MLSTNKMKPQNNPADEKKIEPSSISPSNKKIQTDIHPKFHIDTPLECCPCPICGGKITHDDVPQSGKCFICGKPYSSYYYCENECNFCDVCYAQSNFIKFYPIIKTESKNPIEIFEKMMDIKDIGINGCIHSIAVTMAALFAFKNSAGINKKLTSIIFEIFREEVHYAPVSLCKIRGSNCGIPIAAGNAFTRFIKKCKYRDTSLPAKINDECLKVILQNHGKRNCCKRISYIELITLAKICERDLGTKLEMPNKTKCKYSKLNKDCLKEQCEFYKWVSTESVAKKLQVKSKDELYE